MFPEIGNQVLEGFSDRLNQAQPYGGEVEICEKD